MPDAFSSFLGMVQQGTGDNNNAGTGIDGGAWIFAFLKMNYPAAFTADEVVDRLGVSFLSVRPRLSELHA